LNGQSPHAKSEGGGNEPALIVRATMLDAVEHASEQGLSDLGGAKYAGYSAHDESPSRFRT